ALKSKLNYFGSGGKPGGLFNVGPHKNLIGRNTNDFPDVVEGNLRFELDQETLYDDIDLNAAFMPSCISGRLFTKSDSVMDLNLAISVNGTISAVTWAYVKNGVSEWSAMVPETAFKQGKNDVKVFLVSNVSGRPCLKSIRNQAGFSYTLSASKDREGEVIISSNGTIIPVIPNALELHLDVADRKSGRVLFSGWSVKHLFNPTLLTSGFEFMFPISRLNGRANPEIRIFALSKNGIASELHYPKWYRWAKK
ncbi:MAG: hypothetical protein JRJ09_14180, partial [Deltaproteobacteria bacterium]|nr:hypothetical protein [Deltaproteobacteria bacterium]